MSDDRREPAEEGETAAPSRRFRMPSLSVQVFGALGLGLLAGIFFGERMVVVAPIGDVFIIIREVLK